MIVQLALATAILFAGATRLEQLIAEATEAKSRGDLVRTLELLREAQSIRSSYKIGHNIGAVLEELGRYAEAAAQYRAVIADAETPEDVRESERARLTELEPKIERAWITIQGDHELYIDGEPIARAPKELGFSPGVHLFEVRERGVIRLQRIDLPPGVRTPLAIAGAAPEEREKVAVLLLAGARDRFSGLAVDGSTIRGALSFEELWLDEGSHRLDADGSHQTVQLTRGSERPLVELFPLVATPATEPAKPRSFPTLALIGGGAALVLGVAGAVLIAGASSDRAAILDLPRQGDLRIGLTMREAVEIDRSAGQSATIGVVLEVGAAAAAAGALVVWLSE